MNENSTLIFPRPSEADKVEVVLKEVYQALLEKGYNPLNQLIGYLLSEDPTYITSHRGARTLITKVDRDDILKTLLLNFLEN